MLGEIEVLKWLVVIGCENQCHSIGPVHRSEMPKSPLGKGGFRGIFRWL
jgi:hypothetical protein